MSNIECEELLDKRLSIHVGEYIFEAIIYKSYSGYCYEFDDTDEIQDKIIGKVNLIDNVKHIKSYVIL